MSLGAFHVDQSPTVGSSLLQNISESADIMAVTPTEASNANAMGADDEELEWFFDQVMTDNGGLDMDQLNAILDLVNHSDSMVYNGTLDFDYGPMDGPPAVSKAFEFVVEGVLLMIVSIFGVAGNIINIIVLSRPSMKGSFSSLLIGLSVFDLMYLVIAIAIFSLPALWTWYSKSVYVFIVPVAFGFGHIGRVGSVFFTMSVTIERFFAIVYPLKYFSGKRFLLIWPTVMAVLYNIPKFLEMERRAISVNGTVQYIVKGTALRDNPAYVKYYIFWSKFIIVELIPYVTILLLNSKIIHKIYKSHTFRKRFVNNGEPTERDPEQSSRQKREANLGIVLVCISVLFVACQSLKIVPDVYEVMFCKLFKQEWMEKCPTTVFVNQLIETSHLLLAINSSANFFIYAWRGAKYREVLFITLGLRKPALPQTTLTSTLIHRDLTAVTSDSIRVNHTVNHANNSNGEEAANLIRQQKKDQFLWMRNGRHHRLPSRSTGQPNENEEKQGGSPTTSDNGSATSRRQAQMRMPHMAVTLV